MSQGTITNGELYQKLEQTIRFLETCRDRPDTSTLLEEAELLPAHFQRLFRRFKDVMPEYFLQQAMCAGTPQAPHKVVRLEPVFYTAALNTHKPADIFVSGKAVVSGVIKPYGKGMDIFYGFHETPFGYALLANTPHGICQLSFFTHPDQADASLAAIRATWPQARLIRDDHDTARYIGHMFLAGQSCVHDMPLHLHGTPFQLKVWLALLAIPEGALSSYSGIAAAIDLPKATRAVGGAVGDNPIGFLIPCHRILRKDGSIGGFATGTARKRAMLAYEALALENNR